MNGVEYIMKILRADQEDAQFILDIQKVAYLSEAKTYNNFQIEPLTESLYQMKEDFQKKIFLKAILNGEIVGSVRGYEGENTCYVERLMTHPDYQKRGIGKNIMIELEKYFPSCKRFQLYTGSLSLGNIRLYESLGYKKYKIEIIRENIEFVFLEKCPTND